MRFKGPELALKRKSDVTLLCFHSIASHVGLTSNKPFNVFDVK